MRKELNTAEIDETFYEKKLQNTKQIVFIKVIKNKKKR